MQKIHITLLIILSSVLFSARAVAQNKPLACQVDASTGLKWENGGWITATFKASRFILVQTEDGLTTESVAKVLEEPNLQKVLCRNIDDLTSCSEGFGASIYFNAETLKGGTSVLYGAGHADYGVGKDTVTVTAFSCTPF